MTVLAENPIRSGKAAALLLVFSLVPLTLGASASAAPVATGRDTPDRCVRQTGDDPAWSRPGFNDRTWPQVDVRASWRKQGLLAYDGIVWFRCTARLGDDTRLIGNRNELGVSLGAPAYGGYEAFAGRRWIGRSRGWSSALAFGFPEVFRIPRDAISSNGTVDLALRVRRISWASDLDRESGPVSGSLTFGAYSALAYRQQARWTDHLLSEVPALVLAALFAIAFLHHLLLFGRWPKQTEHLWFALLSLAFALNTFASTYWIYEVTVSRGVATRITDSTGHLAAALAIQFLWTFFSRRIPPALRAYQLSHVALACFVGLWPDLRPIVESGTARWLWLLPLLALAAVFVLGESWRGNAEAQLIAGGGLTMVVLEAAELARHAFGLALPVEFSLAPFGFGAAVAAMDLALSLRFRRVHEELDRLRYRLEDEVRERTRELEEARDDALAGLRVKSEFLANISHEIRTPLSGVIGVAELLARTPLAPEQRTHLKAIQVSGRSLLDLIDDIIDFSRLEANALRVEHRPFRPQSILEQCLEIMTPLAHGKGLALTSSVADNSIQAMSGDPHRTRQVLLNLLSNAIKFTASGRIDVAMNSKPMPDGRVEVRFSVADTGQGMASEDVGRLFAAFQQLEGSASRQQGGAGLGLAISKRLAELMGGTITVGTAPSRGSTFHFTIVGDPAEIPSPTVDSYTPAGRSLRVLLAEDDLVNQIIVLDMLQRLGHQADSVKSGAEALQALHQQAYDVVLMDIQMPDLDGFEVTRRIRSFKGNQIRIIALTAHALPGERERCLAARMDDYLAKPVSISDLGAALSFASSTGAAHTASDA